MLTISLRERAAIFTFF